MEFIILLLVIVVLYFVNKYHNDTQKRLDDIDQKLIMIRRSKGNVSDEPTEKSTHQTSPQPVKPLPETRVSQKTAPPKKTLPDEHKNPIQKAKPEVKPMDTSPPAQMTSPKKTSETNKKDMEAMIGENWLNKIGIAILVVGIGFFVKFAIDKNWINEAGRVAIGIGSGGVLILLAHILRKKYRAFSSVLFGGGISTLYYTIAISYHDYHLFGQQSAFLIMTGITLLSSLASIFYDRRELAIIALLGAFTSPFMVQGETQNIVVFFTYLAIINSGMLLLSYFKKWNELSRLAFAFTTLFFGGWFVLQATNSVTDTKITIVFATLYFIQFLGMNLLYNLVRKVKFNAWEFIQLSSISVLFYTCVIYALEYQNIGFSGSSFTLLLSTFFIGLSILVHKIKGTDKALRFLLPGKAVTFLTLFAPLALDGDHMTIFWAVESIVLLVVGLRYNLKILVNASFIVNIIAVFGLARNWLVTYPFFSGQPLPLFNTAFVTGLIVSVSLMTCFLLTMRAKSSVQQENFKGLAIITGITGYLTLLLEFVNQLKIIDSLHGRVIGLFIFHFILILILQNLTRFFKQNSFKSVMQVIAGFGIIGYLVLGQLNNIEILHDINNQSLFSYFFYWHYVLLFGFIGITFFFVKQFYQLHQDSSSRKLLTSCLSIAGLVVLTFELDQIMAFGFMDQHPLSVIFGHTRTEGYTTLWGLYSFALMLIGMKRRNKGLRVISLIIFTITLLKLFVLDIQQISEAGKIVAFISLGILLLIVSFMYQKLKRLIVGESEA